MTKKLLLTVILICSVMFEVLDPSSPFIRTDSSVLSLKTNKHHLLDNAIFLTISDSDANKYEASCQPDNFNEKLAIPTQISVGVPSAPKLIVNQNFKLISFNYKSPKHNDIFTYIERPPI